MTILTRFFKALSPVNWFWLTLFVLGTGLQFFSERFAEDPAGVAAGIGAAGVAILLPTAVGLYRSRLRPWRWVRDTAYRVWYGSSVALLLASFVASNIAPENSALFALFLVAHLVTLGVAHRALRVAEKRPKEEPLPSAEEGETTEGDRANEDATPDANDAKANVVSRLLKAVSPVAWLWLALIGLFFVVGVPPGLRSESAGEAVSEIPSLIVLVALLILAAIVADLVYCRLRPWKFVADWEFRFYYGTSALSLFAALLAATFALLVDSNDLTAFGIALGLHVVTLGFAYRALWVETPAYKAYKVRAAERARAIAEAEKLKAFGAKKLKAFRADFGSGPMTPDFVEAVRQGRYLPILHTWNGPLLDEDESVVFQSSGQRRDVTERVTEHSGGYLGGSLRVTKNISVQFGGTDGKPVYGRVAQSTPGELVLTTRRVLFLQSEKPFSIRLSELDAVTSDGTALTFLSGDRSYTVELSFTAASVFDDALRGLRRGLPVRELGSSDI